MKQTRILLDSNAYFRLAKSIHPLLNRKFGDNEYVLYVNEYLERQFKKSIRLPSKFYWIMEKEYVENRKNKISISKKEKQEIENAYEFIWETQNDLGLKLLYDDIYCIAYSLVLDIPLVTDDSGVIMIAKEEYGLKIMGTLELLKLMLDCGHIDLTKIIEVVGYWIYNNDLPKKNFYQTYKKVFGFDFKN